MKISYYPGCTLKNTAKNFEDSTLFSLKTLGVGVEELPRWNCCGTVFSLATDDLMHHIGPVRTLLRVQEAKSDSVLTLCAMCYNTLKRANDRMKAEPDSLQKINNFMTKEETVYNGDVEVIHVLQYLRDELKLDQIRKKIVKPLENLKVACYYGCLLVRPKEVAIDDVENPSVLENLVTALGGTPIDFPYKTECCAAYQTVDNPEIIADRTNQILSSGSNLGADVVIVSCPLCAFNLDHRQKETLKKYPEFKNVPILYFSQILAIALGCSEDHLGFDLHYIDPKPVLKEKGLLT